MSKIKLIAICGKAGSGKDTILHLLRKYDIHEIISCTTRPIRQGEQDGVNYHFLSNEEFAQKIINGDMLEATVFNTWGYGTSKSALDPDKWNVGVFNPEGIEDLLESHELDMQVFYIYAPDKLRVMRQLTREDDPDVNEIVRRFGTDATDFQFLESRFSFIKLDNIAQGDEVLCAERIAKMCGLGRLN